MRIIDAKVESIDMVEVDKVTVRLQVEFRIGGDEEKQALRFLLWPTRFKVVERGLWVASGEGDTPVK